MLAVNLQRRCLLTMRKTTYLVVEEPSSTAIILIRPQLSRVQRFYESKRMFISSEMNMDSYRGN